MNVLSNGGCHVAGSLFHVPLPAVVADVHRASCSPASVAAHGAAAIPRYREGWEENNWRIWEYLRLMGECLMEHDRIISGYIWYINLYLMIIWWILMGYCWENNEEQNMNIYIYTGIQLSNLIWCILVDPAVTSEGVCLGGYSWDHYWGWFDPTLLFHTDDFWRRESLRLVQDGTRINQVQWSTINIPRCNRK